MDHILKFEQQQKLKQTNSCIIKNYGHFAGLAINQCKVYQYE